LNRVKKIILGHLVAIFMSPNFLLIMYAYTVKPRCPDARFPENLDIRTYLSVTMIQYPNPVIEYVKRIRLR
jgi:hypothetical protein